MRIFNLVVGQKRTSGKIERDTYSRFVMVLKWVFPILAVALLASIFVLSKTKVGEIIIADPRLLNLAQGQKITNPHFSGVTKSGDVFSLSAEWALPDGPKPEKIELGKPEVKLAFEDRGSLITQANEGALNLATNEARLSNRVHIETPDGYIVQSEGIALNLETGNLTSAGAISATGPAGSITAGSMTFTQDLQQNSEGQAVLVFNNGVKLIYTPNRN